MLAALARLFTPSSDRAAPPMRLRRFEGAAGGRRLASAGVMPNLAQAGLAARGRLASRARYLVSNNALAASGAQAWISGLVGAGIVAQSQHPDQAVREVINALQAPWVDRADMDGVRDLYALQAAMVRGLVVDGEAFAVMGADPDTGETRVRIHDPDSIDSLYDRDRIIAGVEFDGYGRRIAYHILRDSIRTERVRVPASDVVHLFKADAPGQVRGVSWFAPVILKLFEADKAADALGMRLQISAMLCGLIVSPNGDSVPPQFGEGVPDGANGLVDGLEPGTLKTLGVGEDIRFTDPPSLGAESVQFLTLTAREIAAGLGLPYEALSGDLSQVNYSSIRAGLVEWRRRCEALQHGLLAFQVLRPIYRRWITGEVLRGALAAPGFFDDPEPWLSVRFMPPRNDWVDPAKDVQAEVAAINAGLMSRRQAVAARGYDLEQLDLEIAEDNARAASLGLAFTTAPAPAAQGVAP